MFGFARNRRWLDQLLHTHDTPQRTAAAYAHANSALIAWTMGVNHSTKGTETVNAINNLALITGNIGRTGASPFKHAGRRRPVIGQRRPELLDGVQSGDEAR